MQQHRDDVSLFNINLASDEIHKCRAPLAIKIGILKAVSCTNMIVHTLPEYLLAVNITDMIA